MMGVSLYVPRTSWPDTSVVQPGYEIPRDTATLRREAVALEAVLHRTLRPPGGALRLSSWPHLALGDSAGALKLMRYYVDTLMPARQYLSRSNVLNAPAYDVRAMRLRGELAAAAGLRDEAIIWIDRVLDLWTDPSPSLREDVARLRALRARVAGESGSTPPGAVPPPPH